MDEHLTDQQLIDLSIKNPLEVFSCEDGRTAFGGKIYSREEAQFISDIQQHPRAARLIIKTFDLIHWLNPLHWFKKTSP
jgi:hypothetical protein